MTLVVGLYDSLRNAHDAVSDLVASGFSGGSVSVLLSDETPLPDATSPAPVIVSASGRRLALHAAGPLARSLRGERLGGAAPVQDALCAAGLTRFAASYFNEAICGGGILVAVACDDERVREARDILDTHAPDGFDDRAIPMGELSPPPAPVAHVNGKSRRS